MDGVAVDLQLVAPVLQLVLLAGDGPRQLAGLAHRDESGAERVGDGRRRDEAAGLDTDDAVDRLVTERLGELVDGPPERLGVAEQRRDVTERHARVRVVGDVADVRGQPRGRDRHAATIPATTNLPGDVARAWISALLLCVLAGASCRAIGAIARLNAPARLAEKKH